MKVRIPTPLRSYTDQQAVVDAYGATIDDLLLDINTRYPGLRFRMVDEQGRLRQHMRVFVNDTLTRDLTAALRESDDVTIMQALSGG